MNGVALKIRRMKRFSDELEHLELKIIDNDDGTSMLRMRNKFILFRTIPDRYVADKMLCEMHGIIKRTISDIDKMISLVEERTKQLSLQIFGGNDEDNIDQEQKET